MQQLMMSAAPRHLVAFYADSSSPHSPVLVLPVTGWRGMQPVVLWKDGSMAIVEDRKDYVLHRWSIGAWQKAFDRISEGKPMRTDELDGINADSEPPVPAPLVHDRVLAAMAKKPLWSSQSDIGEAAGCSVASASRVLRRLERDGTVTRSSAGWRLVRES